MDRGYIMRGSCFIRSLQTGDGKHVAGEATIIKQLGDNDYLAQVGDVRCHAIYNIFAGRYFVDDVDGVISRDEPEREVR